MTARREADAARVEAAVKAHAPALLAYFSRRVDPAADCADLLAETLLVLWRRADSLPSRDDEVRPWMFGIARNVLLHHHRSTRRRRALADRLRDALAAAPAPGFDPGDHDDLHRALATLTPADRDLIGLIHWDGFSIVEAGRMLGLNESSVRSRYHRARARLRAQLSPTTDDRGPVNRATPIGADPY